MKHINNKNYLRMLNYYSTGVFPKSLDPPSRFKARQASRVLH